MRLLMVIAALAMMGCATAAPQPRTGPARLLGSEAAAPTPPDEQRAVESDAPMPTPIDGLGTDLGDAFWGYELFYYAGAFASTGVMSQSGADHELRVRASDHLGAGAWTDLANIGGYVVPLATAPAIWIAGLLSEDRTVAGAGSAALLALGVASATTGLLKIASGRPDPDATDPMDDSDRAREFSPFRYDIGSWPSGHTASTISVAAALTAYAPDESWIPLVGYPLGLALGIGMVARDSHWASDVVAGALVGHGIGYSIGRNFRKRVRGEPIDRESLRLMPLSGARGLAVGGRW